MKPSYRATRCLVSAGLLVLFTAKITASVLTVTDSSDNPSAPAAGSLRKVIADAIDGDEIKFSPTLANTITLGGSELLLDKNLTVTGPGAPSLAISGAGLSRVFRISAGKTVSISGLTIRNGKAPVGTAGVNGGTFESGGEGGAGQHGGGIWNGGTLTVSACQFISNSGGNGGNGGNGGVSSVGTSGGNGGNGGGGGAVFQATGGMVLLADCVFSANTAGIGGDGGFRGNATGSPFARGGSGGNGGDGGAIANESAQAEAVQIVKCSINSNKAGLGGNGRADAFQEGRPGQGGAGGQGGGFFSSAGTVSAVASTFQANEAGKGGAGAQSRNSNLSYGGSGGVGGAIAHSAGSLTLSNCTVSGNRAGKGGNTVYSGVGNRPGAGGNGGGIHTGGNLVCVSSTITANSAGDVGAVPVATDSLKPADGSGGGISKNAGTATLRHTIVAANVVGPTGSAPDAMGLFASNGYNLLGNADGSSGFIAGTNGDLAGTGAAPLDARLGPLANNGGPTFTHSPLTGSPAINAGDDTPAGTDQRGFPRLYSTHVDIGSVETQPLDDDNDGLLDAWELKYWPTTSGHSATDDFDGDGLVELVEEALGFNPTIPDGANPLAPVSEGGYLTVTLTKQAGVNYEVQSAGTLIIGQPASFNAATTTVLINNSTTLKVRDNVPINNAGARYLRLKVTAAP